MKGWVKVIMLLLPLAAALPAKGQGWADSVFHWPYCFDFDDVVIEEGVIIDPLQWGMMHAHQGGDNYYTASLAVSSTWRSGHNCLYYPSVRSSHGAMLVLPEFDFDSSDAPVLGFWCWNRTLSTLLHSDDTSRLTFGYVETTDLGYASGHRRIEPSTFTPVRTVRTPNSFTWRHLQVEYPAGLPPHSRLAFRYENNNFGSSVNSLLFIDDLTVTANCAVGELRNTTPTGYENFSNCLKADSLVVDWRQTGTPTVRLTLQRDDGEEVELDASTHPVTLRGLSYRHAYTVRLTAWCGDDSTACTAYHDSVMVYGDSIDAEACLPMALLNYCRSWGTSYPNFVAPYVSGYENAEPYYPWGPTMASESGSFDKTGVGKGNAMHALHFVPGERDPMTGFQLATVPPGHALSNRVGGRNAEQEWVDGDFRVVTVDTADYDLLIVRYAAVQSAMPSEGAPPRFDIDLMRGLIRNDSLPGSSNHFSLSARSDLTHWHRYQIDRGQYYIFRDSTYWHDWMPHLFDLSSQHGNQVDIVVSSHKGFNTRNSLVSIGYAYYTLECFKRYNEVRPCTAADSLLLRVPYGLVCRWHVGDRLLGTADSLWVPNSEGTYHCRLANPEGDSCAVEVCFRVLPGEVVRLAYSDTIVENELPYLFHGIEFRQGGDTTVAIPVEDGCDTAVHLSLHVWPNQRLYRVRRVCPDGWPVVFEGYTFDSPDSVELTYTDMHGADSTVVLVAVEAPQYEVGDTLRICPGQPYAYEGVDYGGPTVVDLMYSTVDGCDSLVHLALEPADSSFHVRAYHSVDLVEWSDTVPIRLCSNERFYARDSSEGVAAWRWTALDDGHEWTQAGFSCLGESLGTRLQLVVTSEQGCLDSLEWPVILYPAPEADFDWRPSRPVDLLPEVQFVNLTQPADCEYTWWVQNGEGTDTLLEAEPHYRFPGELPAGDFDVALTATFSWPEKVCTDTVHHAVTVYTSLLQFPNLVTPNGDGVNDRWEVVNLLEYGLYPMNELWIYSPWGVLVYHARNISTPQDFWDPEATRSPDGTYYFRFAAQNPYGSIRRNGLIEVVR